MAVGGHGIPGGGRYGAGDSAALFPARTGTTQLWEGFFRTGLIFGKSLMLFPQEVRENRSCKPVFA